MEKGHRGFDGWPCFDVCFCGRTWLSAPTDLAVGTDEWVTFPVCYAGMPLSLLGNPSPSLCCPPHHQPPSRDSSSALLLSSNDLSEETYLAVPLLRPGMGAPTIVCVVLVGWECSVWVRGGGGRSRALTIVHVSVLYLCDISAAGLARFPGRWDFRGWFGEPWCTGGISSKIKCFTCRGFVEFGRLRGSCSD